MDERTYDYAEGLLAFYEGEILGEAFYSALLETTDDPVERLELAHLLQLETETKAWLRPHLVSAGVSLVEPVALREAGRAYAQAQPSDWYERMKSLAEGIETVFAGLYGRYGDIARSHGRADEAAVCDFMVDHEMAQVEFARRDMAGEPLVRVLEPLRRHSQHLLPLTP